MTGRTDIIATLEPSRALDAAIHTRFFGPVLSLKSGHFVDNGLPVPAYSSSIDAAVALCNTLLPGWLWRLCSCYCTDDAWLMPDYNNPTNGKDLEAQFAQSQEPGHDPLDNGPGLDLSFDPPGRPALGLIAVLLAVMDGIDTRRPPHDDARELHALAALASTPREISRHPCAPQMTADKTSLFEKIISHM